MCESSQALIHLSAHEHFLILMHSSDTKSLHKFSGPCEISLEPYEKNLNIGNYIDIVAMVLSINSGDAHFFFFLIGGLFLYNIGMVLHTST